MSFRPSGSRRTICLWFVAILLAAPTWSPASAQQFDVKPIAERKIPQLPPGPLFWRIDTFPTLAQAQAAAGPNALAAEAAGKDWLFTLGPKGASSPGGTEVAEIGPVPPISATEYLLRVNITELSQKTPHGMNHIPAGQFMPGHGPGMPMQVSSSGSSDLTALVMFVADATKPFSSPATMP